MKSVWLESGSKSTRKSDACTIPSCVSPKNEEEFAGGVLQAGTAGLGMRIGELGSIEASLIVRHGSTKYFMSMCGA